MMGQSSHCLFSSEITKKCLFLKFFQTSILFSSESTLLLSAAWAVLQSKQSIFKRFFSQEKPIYCHFWWKKEILKEPFQPKSQWNRPNAFNLGKIWTGITALIYLMWLALWIFRTSYVPEACTFMNGPSSSAIMHNWDTVFAWCVCFSDFPSDLFTHMQFVLLLFILYTLPAFSFHSFNITSFMWIQNGRFSNGFFTTKMYILYKWNCIYADVFQSFLCTYLVFTKPVAETPHSPKIWEKALVMWWA